MAVVSLRQDFDARSFLFWNVARDFLAPLRLVDGPSSHRCRCLTNINIAATLAGLLTRDSFIVSPAHGPLNVNTLIQYYKCLSIIHVHKSTPSIVNLLRNAYSPP